MHDVSTIINALVSLIGGLVIAYNAWGKKHRTTYQDTIKTLREEVNQKKEDTEFYRQRWLTAEKGNDEKDKTIAQLKRKIERLENEKH
ncbi:hypothetical protein [uncultured Lactobacillus sp.]|uniref:hypothetical protein n=1 Tax=uncultured Lactobacillus sp. TaxID=153152 RepID=UPI0026045506|nr:hypothetical protein [uncultured Lactobacillus sp.]